jgi:hypothetical protein
VVRAPVQQGAAFPTPTPGPDGKIIYFVQQGDDFWTIAAVAGISVEELYALNGIQPGDYAIPGMELLLGYAGPEQATAEAARIPTDTPPPPTPTPLVSTADLCVLLFLDLNGDASLAESEPPLAGGQVSVIDASGAQVEGFTTDEDAEGTCVENLDPGEYNVSAAVPPGYNPTTTMNIPLRLSAGDVNYVQFGAQPSGGTPNAQSQGGSDRALLFGILGTLMIAAAGVLGYFAYRYERRTPASLK